MGAKIVCFTFAGESLGTRLQSQCYIRSSEWKVMQKMGREGIEQVTGVGLVSEVLLDL